MPTNTKRMSINNVGDKEEKISKDMLKRHRLKQDVLAQLEELIQRIEARITEPPTAGLSGMPVQGGIAGDALAQGIVNLYALKEMYNAHWDAVIDERDMIVKAIAKYSERERKLITCRYIENMSWEEIADKIGCSVDYAKGYLRSITINRN